MWNYSILVQHMNGDPAELCHFTHCLRAYVDDAVACAELLMRPKARADSPPLKDPLAWSREYANSAWPAECAS